MFVGPLIPTINQADDQSPGKKDGCHPPSNGARLSLTPFQCPPIDTVFITVNHAGPHSRHKQTKISESQSGGKDGPWSLPSAPHQGPSFLLVLTCARIELGGAADAAPLFRFLLRAFFCGFVLAAAIWLSNSPLRTAVISVSMTFGSWSKERTAMAVLPFSNSTVRDGYPRHTFRCQRDATLGLFA